MRDLFGVFKIIGYQSLEGPASIHWIDAANIIVPILAIGRSF